MVVFYKNIYTEILLCRRSWGSTSQARTPCSLDSCVCRGLAGMETRPAAVMAVVGDDTHTLPLRVPG